MSVEKITIKFDEENMTLGDLEDFEDITGVPLFEALKPVNVLDDDGKPVRDEKGRPVQQVNLSAKGMRALVYITLRHERPGFTPEDARNIKVAALEIVDNGDDEGNDVGESVETPDVTD